MNTKEEATYLRFLNLTQYIHDKTGFPEMDPVEERLLNALAVAWYAGKDVRVIEALGLPAAISSSTAHRRLKSLRRKGMVGLEQDKVDSRIKYVVATDLADEYFTTLGTAMEMAKQR